jgi:hypothetical protein
MTVEELIGILEGFEPTATVRIAQQPNYPLQTSVSDVVEVEMPTCTICDDDEDDEDECDCDGATETFVYIAEGEQVREAPYLPGFAARELGWR